MKIKINARFLGVLLCFVMLMCLLPMAVFAAVDTIEGTVYASKCPTGDLVMTGNTTLIMDKDITLRSIRGDYDLTILDQGGHTLTISMPMSDNVITANGAGHGIAAKNLTSNADLNILARKDAIHVDGTVEYHAKTLGITCNGIGVYAQKGNIYLFDVTSVMITSKGVCLSAPKGYVQFRGDYLNAETTGEYSQCIAGQRVKLEGGTITASSNEGKCIVAEGYEGVQLAGKITASGGPDYGSVINARSGSITIAEGADLYIRGKGYGLYGTKGVIMEGSGKLDIESTTKAGICAYDGDITLRGEARIRSGAQAIVADKGSIDVLATTITVRNTDSYYSAIQGKQVFIKVNEGTIYSPCQYAVRAAGNMDLDGYLKITTDSTKTPSAVLKTTDGGEVALRGVSTVTLVGNDKAIDCDGTFYLDGATLKAQEGFKTGVIANNVIVFGGSMYVECSADKALSANSGDIDIKTGEDELISLTASCYTLEALNGKITIDGNVSATSTLSTIHGALKRATKSDSLLLKGGKLTVDAAQIGVETDHDIIMTGGVMDVKSNYASIISLAGNVDLNGTIRATQKYITGVGATSAIWAQNGQIKLAGDVQIKAYTNVCPTVYTEKDVILSGDESNIVISSNDWYAIYGDYIRVNTHLTASSSSEWVAALKAKSGIILHPDVAILSPLGGYIPSTSGGSNGSVVKDVLSDDPVKDVEIGAKLYAHSDRIYIYKNGDEETKVSVAMVGDEISPRITGGNHYGIKSSCWERSDDGGQTWNEFGSGSFSTPYTVKAGDRGSVFRKKLTLYGYSGVYYTNTVSVPEATALTGSIVFTSGAKVGGRLTTARTGVLHDLESAASFQWQHSPDGVNYWSDIEGATNTYYNITAADVGTFLRLTASVDGMTGKVVSPVKEIAKAPAGDTVAMAALSYADGVVTVTRAFDSQEYVMTLSANPPTENEWKNAVSPDTTGALDFSVSGSYLNNSVYVHTRLKETDTTLAGTKVKYSTIYTGTGEYLAGLTLKNSSGSPVSNENTKVGRIVAVTVAPLPETYPAAQWSSQTVNWYVNNNPKYPGAVELYKDSACTQPLERDEYGVIKPTTQHTVYYKATSWTYDVMIGAEKTIGYNQIVNAHTYLAVSNEDDLYILQNMYFESIEVFPGDEIVTSFATRPDKSYLGTLTFAARDTNPASELTLTADTAAKKLTVTVPEDAEPGVYAYDYYIDGAKPAGGTFAVITVKEKSATVSFDAGAPAEAPARRTTLMALHPTASLMTASGMEPQTVPLGSQYILPENGFEVPEGWEFNGWDVGESGDGIDVTEDVTITAKWKQHIHNMTHTVFLPVPYPNG